MNAVILVSLMLLGASLAGAQQADAPAPSGPPVATGVLPAEGGAPIIRGALPPTDVGPAEGGVAGRFALPSNEGEGPDAIPGTNDVNDAAEPGQTNGATELEGQAQDNGPRGAARRSSGRQSRQNRFARERQRSRFSRDNPGGGTASGANGPASLDFSAFRVIAELNIFDPNRVPSGPRPVQAPTAEYFGLVGTMRYDKGTLAFFSGSSEKYSRVLKVSDSIAGYKLTHIAPDSVKLASTTTNLAPDAVKPASPSANAATGSGRLTNAAPVAVIATHGLTNFDGESVKLAYTTNELEMRMGMQMRREEAGPWQLSAAPSTSADTSSFTPVSGSPSSGAKSAAATGSESDILKRMMQRREHE